MPADLLHFKAYTIGKPVVMGRKTFDSIGKPLKLRRNIVLSTDKAFFAEGIEIARSVEDVLEATGDNGEVMVIGGAGVFNAFTPYVDSIYATEIDADVGGDVVFSFPERHCARTLLHVAEPDERNAYRLSFARYDFTVHPEQKIGGSTNESKPSV